MLTTSLYKILPKTNEKNKVVVFIGFASGILTSLFLNFIVHAYASESLIHCSHGDADISSEGEGDEEQYLLHYDTYHNYTDNDPALQSQEQNSNLTVSTSNYAHKNENNHRKTQDLKHDEALPSLTKKKSFIDRILHRDDLIGSCKTFSNKCHSPSAIVNTDSNAAINNNNAGVSATNDTFTDNNNNVENAPQHNIQNEDNVCLGSAIGYDLQNLDQYRKNFFDYENCSSVIPSVQHPTQDMIEHNHNNSGTNHHNHNTTFRSNSVVKHGSISSLPLSAHQNHLDDHHHHVETPFSKLLSIGIQTCVVLTLHKIPEGLILFYTNVKDSTGAQYDLSEKIDEQNNTLGFSIFLSLAIHNFIEGFSMCLPLYTALSSKIKAILIVSVLAGGSQPLGAVLGYLLKKYTGSKDKDDIKSSKTELWLLSITAGFLFVISLQMFQTAIGFSDVHTNNDDEHGYMSNNSYEGSSEQEQEQEEEGHTKHTVGTACVKWCCLGSLLIILTGLFV
ncbi:uncharacterized protein SCODWIG_00021 [Saccharomycodes ludwigii]|uniref:Zinc-regulated transporter 3 n=2 Tax=Saccharomycodes ludwigii TaxID=36035 RepID=A0A376B2C0_9ASCO|nr:uncharacterized protein SCODWIG_00021 [Saccharomycodes ludwigii]